VSLTSLRMTGERGEVSLTSLAQALLSIGAMSPPGYPSAWLRPRSARFRFARQDHCSSAATSRFSTSG